MGDSDVLARVEFDFSPADLADVNRRSPILQRALRRQLLLVRIGFGIGAAWGLGLLLPGQALLPEPRWWPAIAAAGLLGGWLGGAWTAGRQRTGIERLLREAMHGADSARCVVELRRDAVVVRQLDQMAGMEWAHLEAVEEQGSDVELRGPMRIVVRARAFATPAARAEFVATARRLHAAARADVTPSASS
jgi:hypothetical protein